MIYIIDAEAHKLGWNADNKDEDFYVDVILVVVFPFFSLCSAYFVAK